MNLRTACIVLPTYNEAGNIIRILDRIYNAVRIEAGLRVITLIVDDNSPDGTAQLALDYRKVNNNVHVLQRAGKEGLGAAYIAGMRYALREFRPNVILEMDADGSHNPTDILRLLNAVENGADVAIGSRYVTGGSTPPNMGFYRRLNNAIANTLVRSVLSLSQVKDCTGGFHAIRSSYLEHVDFAQLDAKGYGFRMLLLSALCALGAHVEEVPTHFTDRQIGVSKMRIRDQLGFVASSFRIRAARRSFLVPSRRFL